MKSVAEDDVIYRTINSALQCGCRLIGKRSQVHCRKKKKKKKKFTADCLQNLKVSYKVVNAQGITPWEGGYVLPYTAISRKVVGKNVHVTIPKGNQVRIHTGFHRFTEIGHIFHIKYIYQNKNTLQVEIWPISHLNDLEIQERGL